LPILEPVNEKSLADRVVDQLRDAITDGRYAPGDRLVERRLAGDLGVSHIPVREALTRLAEEGLVERLPRRGSRVAAIDAKGLEELSGLRVRLEQYVVERAMDHWTPKAERALREIVAQMEQAAKRGDTRRLYALDVRFHEQLWGLTDHAILIELVSQLRGRISGFLRAATAALEPRALRSHAASHGLLVDAIASGDTARARAAMAAHVEEAAERIRATLPEPGAHAANGAT
jgi:DNA-binding GntR family transcriptional regulator